MNRISNKGVRCLVLKVLKAPHPILNFFFKYTQYVRYSEILKNVLFKSTPVEINFSRQYFVNIYIVHFVMTNNNN